MKTITNQIYTNQTVIKNSKFITIISRVESKKQLDQFLKKYTKNDASHNCYAYRIYDNKIIGGYSDDHEPSSTAGKPIFNVLEKNHLFNVVILVIRYYGGIKLGAGPLTRTYSNCASQIVKLAEIIDLKTYYLYKISFDISNTKLVNSWINQNRIQTITKLFSNKVIYQIQTESEIKETSFFQIIEEQILNKLF
ncbi:YigZ family protein [Mycoplasma putrefaciens]|uniref:IMPACT family protein n=1 Tax=Mycoplasma putrefaciens TaxID=2123 RepID=UPI003DA4A7AD